MTEWSEHVKRYAKKHKMSYREASMNSKCKESYRKKKKMSPRRMKMPGGRGRAPVPTPRKTSGGGRRAPVPTPRKTSGKAKAPASSPRSSSKGGEASVPVDYVEKRNTVGKRKVADYIEQKEIELETYSNIFYMTFAKITAKEQDLGTTNYYQLKRDEVECSELIHRANSILDEILKVGFLRPKLLDAYDAVLENIRQCIEDFKRKYIVLKEEIEKPCPENCQNGIDCYQCGDNPYHKCRLECELVSEMGDYDYSPEDFEELEEFVNE